MASEPARSLHISGGAKVHGGAGGRAPADSFAEPGHDEARFTATDAPANDLLATDLLTFPPSLGELSRARSFAAELAVRAGFGARRIFDITVAVSEACANAIEHSRPTESLELAARLFADRLEFEVFAGRPFHMPTTTYLERAGRNRGMGLPLMAFLSDRFMVVPRVRGGTLVSLMFRRALAPRPGPRPRRPRLVRL